MGCWDGKRKGSEGGIDRHPTDEGGSECPFVKNSRKQESFPAFGKYKIYDVFLY